MWVVIYLFITANGGDFYLWTLFAARSASFLSRSRRPATEFAFSIFQKCASADSRIISPAEDYKHAGNNASVLRVEIRVLYENAL